MTKVITSSALSKTKSFLAISAAAILLTACGSSDSKLKTGTSELNLSAKEAIDNTIIPAATRFQQQTQALIDSSNRFCTAGSITEANLLIAQNQWKATSAAWFELLPYRFGPLVNSELLPTYTYIDSYRLRGTDYTETVRTKIDDLLDTNKTTTINAATFSNLSFQFVGLLPLEIALFEDAANQSPVMSNIVNEFSTQPRKCQVLTGYATELMRRATIVQQGWVKDYRGTGRSYRELVIDGQLETVLNDETGDSAIKKITVSVQEFYDYVANRDIASDVAQISDSIWQLLDNSLKSTESLLQGNDKTTISLNKIMENNRFEQTTVDIQSNISTMRTALEEKNNTDMVAAARVLDGNFKREVPSALNINLGLNFSDGD